QNCFLECHYMAQLFKELLPNSSLAWWHVSVIPATWEAEAGGSLRGSRLACAIIIITGVQFVTPYTAFLEDNRKFAILCSRLPFPEPGVEQ
uniref:Uncharacterized protein n=1 Tax=Chelydra serpentina TaxID=8475 RepID=A0A8C3SY20_CHESE